MKANLNCDNKTKGFLKNQLKDTIEKYKTLIDDNQYDELYKELSLDDKILGITISSFTALLFHNDVNVLSYLHNIPDYFLTNTDIQFFEMPNGFKTIGKEAFRDCRDLNIVLIPKTLNKVEEGAFKNCVNLKTICYKGTPEDFDKIIIKNDNEEFSKDKVLFI